jgi:hypothetical protein
MPQSDWNLTAAAATWWLRRSTGQKDRRKSPILDVSGRALHENASAPLLVLALADDAPLRPLSYFVVERRVAVHHIHGKELAYYEFPQSPGGQDMRPWFNDHEYYANFGGRRSQAEQLAWQRFCESWARWSNAPIRKRTLVTRALGGGNAPLATSWAPWWMRGQTFRRATRLFWICPSPLRRCSRPAKRKERQRSSSTAQACWGTAKTPNARTFASALRPSMKRGRTTGTAVSWRRCTTRAILTRRSPRTTRSM